MQFDELNLKQASLDAVVSMGFSAPTEIQEKSIPLLLEKETDFIGQAQTGTGKTAAFVLPLLEKIDLKSNSIQAVVIAPTRELANQICIEVEKLSKFEPVRTLAVYGGIPISGQLRALKKNKPQIIVGTPGRMLDVINRGAFNLEVCKYVVLDEADEMLDMGFFEDVQTIVEEIPEKKIWMFSATMPKPILNLINKHFCEPELVKVTKKILTSDRVEQKFCVVKSSDQTEALCRYLDYVQDVYAIVFARTKIGTQKLTDELNLRGYPSDSLHGDMSQDQRDITMKKFKQKKINLLVCTDVAARGIDVNDLTHVVNFSLPQDNESYVHRIGRTGRGGAKGVALSIIEPTELRRVSQIERLTQAKIEKIQLPSIEDITNVLIEKSKRGVEKLVESTDFSSQRYEDFVSEFEVKTRHELIQSLYAVIHGNALKRYHNAKPIDYAGKISNRGERSEKVNGAQKGYERFHMNLGKKNSLKTADIIRFVSRKSGIKGAEMGKIQVMNEFSFFEVPEYYSEKVLKLNESNWKGFSVNIQVAKQDGNKNTKSRRARPRRRRR